VHCTLPYALTYEPTLHTFDETQRCQLCHYDVVVAQLAALGFINKDNNSCTVMGNAHKPTARTCHINIKYFTLCEWVERNLICLKRIDTSINLANHLTKPLYKILFH
jgi:hypothetical protein